MGKIEIQNSDSSSWTCKNSKGDLQLLFWDFINTHPGDSVLNQMYYVRELPSRSKGTIKIEISGIPEGKYNLEIYKIGYKVNDAYTTYLSMNKPKQLTIQQVNTIKQQNNGSPISTETLIIDSKGIYSKDISINENDVFLLNFLKQ